MDGPSQLLLVVRERECSSYCPLSCDTTCGKAIFTTTIIGAMGNTIDYSQHTEAELVDIFGRLDPRFAPQECARLGQYLSELGYIVTHGRTGPGLAQPSIAKLQRLIGSSQPFESAVEFGKISGPLSYLGPAHNELGLLGSGKLWTDGIYVYLSGRVGARRAVVPSLAQQEIQLPVRYIANVESQGRWVRFEYRTEDQDPGALALQLPDDSAAAALAAILPKTRTPAFRPQIEASAEFAGRLLARSPRTPITFGLIALNTLVFISMWSDGAGWFRSTGHVQIAWGSNFGPYTTDGDWWRLLTALFIHFGLIHIGFNMLGLASFGPLAERFYGSTRYLLIYLLAGIFGNLCSVSWHPAVNSAGASGAIFGICGALLATLAGSRDRIPYDILRSIGYSTLVFLGWSVYASLSTPGIDYVAHLGGLAAGFILGLTVTPGFGSEKKHVRQAVSSVLATVSVAAVLLTGGFWWALSNAASLTGDGLYYRTIHWITKREHGINTVFNLALHGDRKPHAALIATLDTKVIPFWRDAGDRLGVVELPNHSPNIAALETIQNMSDRRAQAYQLLDEGLRTDDPRAIATAGRELQRIERSAAPE